MMGQREEFRRLRCSQRKSCVLILVLILAVTVLAIGISRKREGPYRICCIGDSITYGSGLDEEERALYAYPARLSGLLGEDYLVDNYGVRGKTMLEIPGRSYTETGYMEQALAQKPDIILIMLGTNDSRPGFWDAVAYREQYESRIVQIQQEAPNAVLYVMLPPEAFAQENGETLYGINNEVISGEIRGIVQEVAQKTHVGVIDLYAVTENHPEYFKDGVHPNKEGYAVIAEAVFSRLSEDSWKWVF